jgi:predicted DNA-binding transcriptional regulator AlpA
MASEAQSLATPATELPALAVGANQLAVMLNVSVRTIRALDCAGKLPRPVRIGGRSVRWAVSEIEGWLRARCPNRQTWETLKNDGRPGR